MHLLAQQFLCESTFRASPIHTAFSERLIPIEYFRIGDEEPSGKFTLGFGGG